MLGFLGGQTRKAFRSSLVILLPMSGCISRAILLLLTFAYSSVVEMKRCPSILLTVSIGKPFSKQIVVAKVCRAVCEVASV